MESSPHWLATLVKEITGAIRSFENVPIGCHTHRAPECWEITLFVMKVEVVGGARDGEKFVLPYHLELSGLASLFDELESFAWQTAGLGEADDLGSHVGLYGKIDGEPVWLRILADAPEQTPVAGRLCANTLVFTPE